MEKTNRQLLRLVGVIFGLTLLISLIVVIIGMVYEWKTPVQYSNGFFVAGAIAIVLGTFSVTADCSSGRAFPSPMPKLPARHPSPNVPSVWWRISTRDMACWFC